MTTTFGTVYDQGDDDAPILKITGADPHPRNHPIRLELPTGMFLYITREQALELAQALGRGIDATGEPIEHHAGGLELAGEGNPEA